MTEEHKISMRELAEIAEIAEIANLQRSHSILPKLAAIKRCKVIISRLFRAIKAQISQI